MNATDAMTVYARGRISRLEQASADAAQASAGAREMSTPMAPLGFRTVQRVLKRHV